MKKIFKDGEAESKVKELREHLRNAAEHRATGNRWGVERAEEAAYKLRDELLAKLATRFERYAYANLAAKSWDDIQDAIQDMALLVWRGLVDLSDRPSARYYEIRFDAAVKSRMKDALDKATARRQLFECQEPISFEAPLQDDDECEETLRDAYADKSTIGTTEAMLGAEVFKLFIGRLPSEKHKKVFWSLQQGATLEAAARSAGVTEKTARKYRDEMELQLKQMLRGEE